MQDQLGWRNGMPVFTHLTRNTCATCGAPLVQTVAGRQCAACLMSWSLGSQRPEPPSDTRTFGDYQLLEELGRGGMGVVYRAWEPKLERTVALKLLLAGPFAGEGFVARFLREARLAARLQHPHLVAVYDAGEAEGQPYYTMELVEGRSLSAVVQQALPPVRQAATWVQTLAEAVESAHAQGVLHCDLKPSNILITPEGLPKITDFGLAKLWREAPEMTLDQTVLGSPSFMAPEQAAGRRQDLSPATDVYALGAVLYHTLTGRPPHQGGTAEEVLAQVRAVPALSPRLLNPSVPRDLETICLKCLDKEPRRRYPTAAELAEDLGRFLRGEAVRARPVGALSRAWRWAQRNRALAAALTALAVVCLAVAGTALWQMRRNQLERERVELEGYVAEVKSAAVAAAAGDYPRARRYLASLFPLPGRPDRRGFEWYHLWAATASQARHKWTRHSEQVTSIAFSPDGQRLATTGFEGALHVSEIGPDGDLSPLWSRHGRNWARNPCFLPDGSVLASLGLENGRPFVCHLTGENTPALRELPGNQISLAARAPRAVIVNRPPFLWEERRGRAEVWDLTTWRRLATPPDFARTAALSPDGHWLALAGQHGLVRLLPVEGEEPPRDLHAGTNQHALAFSPDGRWLASTGRGSAWRWDLTTSPPAPMRLEHPWLNVWQVAFSPDSRLLATTCSDRAVRLWDTATGQLLHTLHGHADEVWSVAFHPSGRQLATGSKEGTLMLWDLPPKDESLSQFTAHTAWTLPHFSPSNRLTGCDLSSGSPQAMGETADGPHPLAPPGWRPCGYRRDGQLLLWSDTEPFLTWWDAVVERFGEPFPQAVPFGANLIFQSGVSDDGAYVFQVQPHGRLMIWDAFSQKLLYQIALPEANDAVAGTALYRARYFLLTRVGPRYAWLVDLPAGEIRQLIGHTQQLKGVALSPDGLLAATASSDGTVRLWDTATGTEHAAFRLHPESTSDVAFSPDGRTLACVGSHQGVAFIHLPTRQEVLTLPLHDAGSFLQFSPDGRRLAITRENENPNASEGVWVLEAPPTR